MNLRFSIFDFRLKSQVLLGAAASALAVGSVFALWAPASHANAPNKPKKFVIGMSQCNLGEPWRVQMNTDVREAAKKHPEIEMLFSDASNKS